MVEEIWREIFEKIVKLSIRCHKRKNMLFSNCIYMDLGNIANYQMNGITKLRILNKTKHEKDYFVQISLNYI